MRTKYPLDVAGDPNFISGIYNYCDRWCERCQFTTRCAVYAAEEAEQDVNPAAREIANAAFWKRLAAIFSETQAMISEMAAERGIDLSSEALEQVRKEKDTQRSDARNHPLAKAAEAYALAVTHWFEQESSKTVLVSDTLEKSEPEREVDDYEHEYVEVIRWYQFFIAAKQIRALTSRVDEDYDLDDDSERDSDGSTKAALAGIERSICAWKLMQNSRPERSDTIRKLLLDLEKLRLSAETEFPRAGGFIRPGFDEPSLDVLH